MQTTHKTKSDPQIVKVFNRSPLVNSQIKLNQKRN